MAAPAHDHDLYQPAGRYEWERIVRRIVMPDRVKLLALILATYAYDASVWVRMSREQPPMVVGARSVRHGLRPGVDEPQPAPDFTLEWLIFEVLRCGEGQVRDIRQLDASQVMPGEEQVEGNGYVAPSTEDVARVAAKGVIALLVAESKAEAAALWNSAKTCIAAQEDVAGLLTQEDREVLGLAEGTTITLEDLAVRVGQYVVKHGRGVRGQLDPATPPESLQDAEDGAAT